jgi:septum site-determining protein MinD
MVRRGDMMSVDDVSDILGVNLIGTITDDENIVVKTNRGEAVAGTNTRSGKTYDAIAKVISGQKDEAKIPTGIFEWIRKKKNVHKVQSQEI